MRPSLRKIVRAENSIFSGLWLTMIMVYPSSLRDLESSISPFPVIESKFPELRKSNFLEPNSFVVVYSIKT
jgi:hypothetical protein